MSTGAGDHSSRRLSAVAEEAGGLSDRYDELPAGGRAADARRIGAHRRPPPRRGWVGLAWAALATGALVGAGVFALGLIGGGSDEVQLPFVTQPSTVPSESTVVPSVVPSLDPAVAITVLNGTTTTGLAGAVGDLLVERGWGGAAIGVGTRLNADDTTVQATVVYFEDASREAAAAALVDDLGVGTAVLSTLYPESPITVVLGKDYVLPVP